MKRSKPLKRKKPMKRTGFKKKGILDMLYSRLKKDGQLSQLNRKPRKRIRPRSKKREKLDKEYSRLRKEFLEMNPYCQVDPFHWSSQIHHKARRGKFYLDTRTWMAVCPDCHKKIEENGEWARANGYTLTTEQRRLLG